MIRKKEIKGPSLKKNPFLNPDGGLDLIEKFPAYEKKKTTKKQRGKIK